jgi:hypothetical protein
MSTLSSRSETTICCKDLRCYPSGSYFFACRASQRPGNLVKTAQDWLIIFLARTKSEVTWWLHWRPDVSSLACAPRVPKVLLQLKACWALKADHVQISALRVIEPEQARVSTSRPVLCSQNRSGQDRAQRIGIRTRLPWNVSLFIAGSQVGCKTLSYASSLEVQNSEIIVELPQLEPWERTFPHQTCQVVSANL